MAILRRLYLGFLVSVVVAAASSSSDAVVVDILSLLGSGSCCCGGDVAVLVTGVSEVSMFLGFLRLWNSPLAVIQLLGSAQASKLW